MRPDSDHEPQTLQYMKRSVRIFWRLAVALIICAVLVVVLAAVGAFGPMPSMRDLENPTLLQTSEVYAADGTLMGKYYREHGNRSNVNYSDISKYVIDALVATEDVRFYHHSGIDMKGSMRAVLTLGRGGGGSTITQQLAKALLEQGSKNKAWRVVEKIKEYIIAVKLERNFTKEEILALYLNAVPFGDNVYGIRNASRTFFQKEPDQLTVDESAMLIGMLSGNTLYNPRKNPKAAIERRNTVINRMVESNYITLEEGRLNKLKPIDLSNYKKLDENNGLAPYFRDVIRDELKKWCKDHKNPATGEAFDLYEDGLRIYTTINPRMQLYAEEAVAKQVPSLQKVLNAQPSIKKGLVWKDHSNIIESLIRHTERWQNMEDEG